MTEGDAKLFSKTSSGETSFSPQNALKTFGGRARSDQLGEPERSHDPSRSSGGRGMDNSIGLPH